MIGKLTFSNSYLESIKGIDCLYLNEENHYKIGLAAGTLFTRSDYKMIKLLKNPFVKIILKIFYSKYKTRLRTIRLPQEYQEELRGYSDATGISYNHILLVNLIYEIRGCSGFAFLNSDGALIVGHNTDVSKILAKFILRYAKPLISNVTIPGKNKFVHVSLPFFVGVANGFNEKGIAVSSHDAGDVYTKVIENNASAAFLIRMVLEKAQNINDVSRIAQNNFSYLPCIILVASEQERKFSILEVYSSDFSLTTVTNRSWITVTNHYQSDKMRQYHKAIKKGSMDRIECLQQVLSGKNGLSVKEAIEVLKDHRNGLRRDVTGYSVTNIGTFQSFVFNMAKREIYISNGNKPPVSLHGDFVKISTSL